MKIEYLIQKIENLINASSTNFEFKVYDSLKMDNIKMDINKINGIARVVSGGFEPIANLGQGSVTISVEFIYPYERLEAVNETLQNVAQGSAGLVVSNSSFSAELQGTTGIAITYPIQGNYYNGTMGETAKSRLVCYFDINEKAVLANDVKIQIESNGYQENNKLLNGEYFILDNNEYVAVKLPKDYQAETIYYQYRRNPVGLPEDFRALEYIEINNPLDRNNKEMFNLDFSPNENMNFEIEFEPLSIVSPLQPICGSFNGYGMDARLYNNKLLFGFGNSLNNEYSEPIQLGEKYKLSLGKNTYINDVLIKRFEDYIFTEENFYVGAYDIPSPNHSPNVAQMKIYSCKLYNDGLIVKDIIPCYRISDNEAGLYDIINQRFYGNASLRGTRGVKKGTEFYEEVNYYLQGKYYVYVNERLTEVNLPKDYKPNTIYYTNNFEDVPYYKYVITRHRLSTTNKYENNTEMQTVNDGQSIDFSLAVPSIKDSTLNKIKDDMLLGKNTQKSYTFRFIDESGQKIFYNMLPSGDFSYEIVPGDTIIFKILFVYKR